MPTTYCALHSRSSAMKIGSVLIWRFPEQYEQQQQKTFDEISYKVRHVYLTSEDIYLDSY